MHFGTSRCSYEVTAPASTRVGTTELSMVLCPPCIVPAQHYKVTVMAQLFGFMGSEVRNRRPCVFRYGKGRKGEAGKEAVRCGAVRYGTVRRAVRVAGLISAFVGQRKRITRMGEKVRTWKQEITVRTTGALVANRDGKWRSNA